MIRVAWWAWLLLVGGFCVAFAASVEHPHLVPASVWWCLGAMLGTLVTWAMMPSRRDLVRAHGEAKAEADALYLVAQVGADRLQRELGELRAEAARLAAENKVLVQECALARSCSCGWRVGPGGVA